MVKSFRSTFIILISLNLFTTSLASTLCGSSVSESAKSRLNTIRNFQKYLATQDKSLGDGLRAAEVYVFDRKKPVLNSQINIKKTPENLRQNQTVWFGQLNSYKHGSSGLGVKGTPTRVYLNPKNGEIAYINFDAQPIQLIETFNHYPKKPIYKVIEDSISLLRQDEFRHPGGFSTPVGPLKSGQFISDMTVEQAREQIGKEGSSVVLEYDSGVIVSGVIESYTAREYSLTDASKKVAVITFKDITARVQFGVHTLYEPDWGPFDMQAAPRLSHSGQLTHE